MHYSDYNSILSAQNGMNLYRGCTHGCIYCDSRSDCYQMNHKFEDIEVKNPVYEAEEIGIVCPVYCFLPPAIVQDFIARSTFKADYFFTIGTFGAHTTVFPEYVNNFANEHGIKMNYISAVQMVDAYLPYFDVARELADPKLDKIPETLAVITAAINNREEYILPVTRMDRMIYEGYYSQSGRDRQRPTVTRSEKIVFSTDACIGCGVCASICPHGSWSLVNGKGIPEGDCKTVLLVCTIVRKRQFPSSLPHLNQKSRTVMSAIVTQM